MGVFVWGWGLGMRRGVGGRRCKRWVLGVCLREHCGDACMVSICNVE